MPSLRSIGLARVVFGVALATGTLAVAASLLGVRLNTSGSIPSGLYRQSHGPITRGSVVLACLPDSVAKFARGRGYLPPGSCPDGSAPIGKVVAAVPGDTVTVSSHGVIVNAKLLENSVPQARDSRGRPLPALRVSARVVQPGELWLVSSFSASSFDSRYFGAIPRTAIVSRVQPLLTAGRR